MHKVLRAMSVLTVLCGGLYLAAPALAADTAAPANTGAAGMQGGGKAMHEKLQQDRTTLKADHEKMRALHEKKRQERMERMKQRREEMKKNRPNGAPAAGGTPAAPTAPAAPATGQ